MGIVATPFIFARKTRPELCIGFYHHRVSTMYFIVEIVIELNAIDIIFLNNLSGNIRHPFANGRNAGIENITIRRYANPGRVGFINAGWRPSTNFATPCGSTALYPSKRDRVQPRVQFDAPLMRFPEPQISADRTGFLPPAFSSDRTTTANRLTGKTHRQWANLKMTALIPCSAAWSKSLTSSLLALTRFGIVLDPRGTARRPIEIEDRRYPAGMKCIAIEGHEFVPSKQLVRQGGLIWLFKTLG